MKKVKRKRILLTFLAAALMMAMPMAGTAQVFIMDEDNFRDGSGTFVIGGTWGDLNDPYSDGSGTWGSLNNVSPEPIGDGLALLALAGIGYATLKRKNEK